MRLKDRISAMKNRPRDPAAIPLSALDPMTKVEIDARRTEAKASMDAALPLRQNRKVAAAA